MCSLGVRVSWVVPHPHPPPEVRQLIEETDPIHVEQRAKNPSYPQRQIIVYCTFWNPLLPFFCDSGCGSVVGDMAVGMVVGMVGVGYRENGLADISRVVPHLLVLPCLKDRR